MTADNAHYVNRWDLLRTVLQPRVAEDQEKLNAILAEGWEPYAAAPAGQIGDVFYFRRQVER